MESTLCTDASPAPDVPLAFVARQPIFDAKRAVLGYELLFRSGNTATAGVVDGTTATAQVLQSGLVEFGIRSLTAGKPAFINVDAEVLSQDLVRLFPPSVLIVEVLEYVPPEPAVLDKCRELKASGYRIALDDVNSLDRIDAFREVIDIVKVDFMATTPEQQRDLGLGIQARHLVALAEKVEDNETFQAAAACGYRLFQGYFFAKPEVMSKSKVSGSKLQQLELMRALYQSPPDVERIESIIRSDVFLSYGLLRYVNSAHFGLRIRVGSVHHALTLLGAAKVRKWATLVCLAGLGGEQQTELVSLGLARAHFCEGIGRHLGLQDHADDLFLVGLLSVLDALVGRPLEDLLADLPLSPAILGALLQEEGAFGTVLRLVRAYERAVWDDVGLHANALRIEPLEVIAAYHEAQRRLPASAAIT